MVGRVLRQRGLPLGHQLRAHDGEQEQHHETNAEGNDLHAALSTPASDIGDSVTPGDAYTSAETLQPEHEEAAREIQSGEGAHCPRQQINDELHVLEEPIQHRADRGRRGSVDGRITERRRLEIMTKHPGRWNVSQLQQRRQGESESHSQRGNRADDEAAGRGRRQLRLHQIVEQQSQSVLRQEADDTPYHARPDGKNHQLR